jgi:hypothetical protein
MAYDIMLWLWLCVGKRLQSESIQQNSSPLFSRRILFRFLQKGLVGRLALDFQSFIVHVLLSSGERYLVGLWASSAVVG